MPDLLSYAAITPLITARSVDGNLVKVTFTCPLTEESIEAEGPLVHGVTLADVSSADQTLLGSLRATLGTMLKSTLFGGASTTSSHDDTTFTEEEIKAGEMLAFKSIANKFVADGKSGRWISTSAAGDLLSDFARQLGLAPVLDPTDREVASRMLVEVARADGQVTQTEWAFLAEFIPGDISSVDTFMEKPRLVPDDLDQATRGAARDTMLMLAWALAHVDHQVDDAEVAKLLSYAKGLKIPKDRALELRQYAQHYLLDAAFERAYPKRQVDAKRRTEALSLGEQLGLSADQVAAAEARYKARIGL